MPSPFSRHLRTCTRYLSNRFLAVALLLATTVAGALSPPPPIYLPSSTGTVTVDPAFAPLNQPRTITVSGFSRCIEGYALNVDESASDANVITLTFRAISAFDPCFAAPHDTKINYTPTTPGNKVIVVKFANSSQALAYGTLSVGDAPSVPTDVSGMWINWSKTSSILNLTHSKGDVIGGVLGTFDAAGKPNWLFINRSRRILDNVYEAVLSEFAAEQFFCIPLDPRCAPSFRINRSTDVGIVRITVYGNNVVALEARTVAQGASFASGTLSLVESYSRYNF
jgi:hypothetical protein